MYIHIYVYIYMYIYIYVIEFKRNMVTKPPLFKRKLNMGTTPPLCKASIGLQNTLVRQRVGTPPTFASTVALLWHLEPTAVGTTRGYDQMC